ASSDMSHNATSNPLLNLTPRRPEQAARPEAKSKRLHKLPRTLRPPQARPTSPPSQLPQPTTHPTKRLRKPPPTHAHPSHVPCTPAPPAQAYANIETEDLENEDDSLPGYSTLDHLTAPAAQTDVETKSRLLREDAVCATLVSRHGITAAIIRYTTLARLAALQDEEVREKEIRDFVRRYPRGDGGGNGDAHIFRDVEADLAEAQRRPSRAGRCCLWVLFLIGVGLVLGVMGTIVFMSVWVPARVGRGGVKSGGREGGLGL
ncbi:hypothetical protein LTS18_015002, partial [Coniosporium uncinatum]